jgi:Arc/MetJ-type ribon-helix-helix transcriptional regulator
MKERKTKQIRVRITESQLKGLVNYFIENPNEFQNQSELIRESIDNKICRKKDIITKSLGRK